MNIFIRIYYFIVFFFYYLKELIIGSIAIAVEIITPRHRMQPGILEIPVDLKSNADILLFVSLISMTPGTLALDLSGDKKKLFVHAMYTGNKEEKIKEIKKLEKKIQKIFG